MVYLLVFVSVAAVTAGQLLVKKGMLSVGQFPQNFSELMPFSCESFYQYLCYVRGLLNNRGSTRLAFGRIKSATEFRLSFHGLVLCAGRTVFLSHLQGGCNHLTVAGDYGNLPWRVSGVKKLETPQML